MDNGAAILKEAGMSFADVVSSRVYIAERSTFQAMNAAYRPTSTGAPPARAAVQSGLTSPDYLVEIDDGGGEGSDRARRSRPPNADGTPGRAGRILSPAIQVGNRLYVAGHDRQHAGEQGRREGADRRSAVAHRARAQGGRLRLVATSSTDWSTCPT